MSHHGPNRHGLGEDMEEAEEAFIDLEDPEVDILDESALPADDVSDASGDDTAEAAEVDQGGADGDGDGDGDDPRRGAEMEDLNAAPDHEPERDDAFATFVAPGKKPLHAVAVHPHNERIFAVSGEGEAVFILDVDGVAGEPVLLRTLEGHTDTVSLLSFSPNGQWLATGSLDSSVALWSTETWERKHVLTDLYGEIMTLLWHPSSLLLAAGADDAQAAMWNVVKGTLVMYFVGHRGPVTCTAWSPDVKKLVTGSSDGSVGVFNPKTGEQELTIAKDLSPDNAGITALQFVNEDQCVVGCEDGTLHVVSLRSGKAVTHLDDVHEQAIESLAMSSGALLLLTASCDCRVVVWNVADFSPRLTLEVGESVIPAVWAHSHLIAAGCSDGDVRVWDGRSSAQEPLAVLMGHRRMVLSLATAATVLASVSDDGTAKFFRFTEAYQ
ncbi:WD domain, G-beta repeat [Novymonas esmeraldas]|uniref:WD domain, G-beta repeat n=1 Tax=Novymonas esmeraldas TaxID=1808958 RepID=A0AAW0EV35_9TRYP